MASIILSPPPSPAIALETEEKGRDKACRKRKARTIDTQATKSRPTKREKKETKDRKKRRQLRPLCCTDERVKAFGIQFRRVGGGGIRQEEAEICVSEEDLLSAANLKQPFSVMVGGAVACLLKSKRIYQWGERQLELRAGQYELEIATDGVYMASRTGAVVAFADLWKVRERRKRYVGMMFPYEWKPSSVRMTVEAQQRLRRRELELVAPEDEFEDPQVAAKMAALGQEVWNRGRMSKAEGGLRKGVWVHLILANPGVGVVLYRAWIPREFFARLWPEPLPNGKEHDNPNPADNKPTLSKETRATAAERQQSLTDVVIEYSELDLNGSDLAVVKHFHSWLRDGGFFSTSLLGLGLEKYY